MPHCLCDVVQLYKKIRPTWRIEDRQWLSVRITVGPEGKGIRPVIQQHSVVRQKEEVVRLHIPMHQTEFLMHLLEQVEQCTSVPE